MYKYAIIRGRTAAIESQINKLFFLLLRLLLIDERLQLLELLQLGANPLRLVPLFRASPAATSVIIVIVIIVVVIVVVVVLMVGRLALGRTFIKGALLVEDAAALRALFTVVLVVVRVL